MNVPSLAELQAKLQPAAATVPPVVPPMVPTVLPVTPPKVGDTDTVDPVQTQITEQPTDQTATLICVALPDNPWREYPIEEVGDKHGAVARYMEECGILSTVHKFAVQYK